MTRVFRWFSLWMILSCGLVAGLAVGLGAPSATRAHDQRPPHHNPFPAHATAVMHAFQRDIQPAQILATVGPAACVDGFADIYPCDNVDLTAFMPLADIGGDRANSAANDIWGWTDPVTGNEYAIVGRVFGTSFVDISDPINPVYLGDLVTHGAFGSSWRDIKVYNDHAFIVSEANGHGMQVFDLTELPGVVGPPVAFSETAHYNGMRSAHNIVINEDSGFAYIVGVSGKNNCSGGLHMVDISDPLNPSFAGCYSGDGYTHDAQCVIYQGGDDDPFSASYNGREICFNGNEDTLTIVEVTDKANPVLISRTTYDGVGYTHQGWLTPDHSYFVLDDELDEINVPHNTRTRFWNLSDLDNPVMDFFFDNTTAAIDHNLYTRGECAFEANYTAGLSILDISGVGTATISEAAYFDIDPDRDAATFNGAWSNYPYFPSGTVVVSGIEQGLFVLIPDLTGLNCPPPAAPEPPAVVEAHVGDLDGASTLSTNGKSWTAEVTITIHDATEGLVENALVTGTWNVNGQNSGSCVTVADGTCTVAKDKIKARTASVTFTVDDVQPVSGGYDSTANHDPDGDFNMGESSITVLAP